jgi:hypothetical protein
MGIEGEKVQDKGTCNIFNITIRENFPNLKKVLPILVQEASRTPNKYDQNRTLPQHIIKINRHREHKKNIQGCRREKKTTNKGKPIKIT